MIAPEQRRLAAAALAVAGEHGFALAGGLALAAHGVGSRPSDDIDLFTSNTDPQAFSTAVDAVHQAFTERGWSTSEQRRGPLYARMIVEVAEGQQYELDLAVDYRAHPAVAVADLGPVLDVADAVGSKMGALYGRGEVRDYVDVREAVVAGRYSREEVVQLADEREVEPLDREVLALRLRQAASLPDRELAAYLSTSDAALLRQWFAAWANELRTGDPAPSAELGEAAPRIQTPAPDASQRGPELGGPGL